MEITSDMYKGIIALSESMVKELKKNPPEPDQIVTWKAQMLGSGQVSPEDLGTLNTVDDIVKYMEKVTDNAKIEYYDSFVK